jgi:prolyl-tRNA synthetase
VHLVPVGRGEEQLRAAEALAGELESAGRRVLLDDREASAGEKFADADLIGVPTIVVVGKGLAGGNVEVKDRKSGERRVVALGSLVAALAP